MSCATMTGLIEALAFALHNTLLYDRPIPFLLGDADAQSLNVDRKWADHHSLCRAVTTDSLMNQRCS